MINCTEVAYHNYHYNIKRATELDNLLKSLYTEEDNSSKRWMRAVKDKVINIDTFNYLKRWLL